jgi:hypothetical protein
MKKTTQALSITLAMCLCANVMAKDCDQEKVQVYAHPSLMNANATEVKDADYVYRIGGKVLKQKNRIGFTNKENLFVNAYARDLLDAMSVKKGDKEFDVKMPVSRSEIAFMLANGLNMKDLGYHKNYTDVTSSYWADAEIKTATAADVMIGYPDKSFKPDQAITKAEVFAVVAKLIEVPYSNDGSAPVYNGKKMQNIPTWAYGCTKEVIASGLLANVPDVTSLLEAPYLSRQQVATLVGELRLKYGANGQLVGEAFSGTAAPVAVKIKMLDRVDAKHSNIGDRFAAKTTEEVYVAGQTFPAGSVVYGEVVTVQRPGVNKDPEVHNNLGSITVKFTEIKNGDVVAKFPKEMTSATADKLNNPNIFARILGLPFTAAARTVGVAGRSAGQAVNIAANGLEEYGDRLSDTFVETLTGHAGRGAASFGNSFVTLGKGVYGIVKTAISGTFGIIYEIGDELLYTIVPNVSNSAALNPNEELTVIF